MISLTKYIYTKVLFWLLKTRFFSLLVDFVKKNASQLNGELRLRDVVIPEYLILGSGEKKSTFKLVRIQ